MPDSPQVPGARSCFLDDLCESEEYISSGVKLDVSAEQPSSIQVQSSVQNKMKFVSLFLVVMVAVLVALTSVGADPIPQPGFSKGVRPRRFHQGPSVIYQVAHPPPFVHFAPQPVHFIQQPVVLLHQPIGLGHGPAFHGKGFKG
ncbi:uncharacterized protein LOC125031399 [Penaeus chinensis]|uniref:uncharacterized protein LOC125031399 n=1 Tax=Penaeus chinensis TaxID=139456 RepID=UPI001FB6A0D1|nr:uncharacterized protein LOC125031399 [Penaeus chinensis]